MRLWKFAGFRHYKEVIRIGFPGSIQNIIFSAISMIIARPISRLGRRGCGCPESREPDRVDLLDASRLVLRRR